MDIEVGAYTALRQAPRKILSDLIPLPAPFTIYLELTNICNFKCSYCPIHFDDYSEIAGGNHTLSEQNITKIYNDIKSLGRLKTLNFYYLGEPFVHRKITDFVKKAKDMDIAERLIITTNGTLLNPSNAQAVVESGLDFIRFSIYGTTQAELTAVTGTKISYEKIINNIKMLRDVRNKQNSQTPHIYVKMIESTKDETNQRFYEIFKNISDECEIESAMNWSENVEQTDLSGLGTSMMDGTYFRHKKEVCPYPFYTLGINADMKVTVCCVDWKKETEIGNLNESSLADIWNGEKMHNFRMKHLLRQKGDLSACKDCTFLHTAPDNIDKLQVSDYLQRITHQNLRKST
jgi:radical SAM protein with 4Fe4S-binding SPASM domain